MRRKQKKSKFQERLDEVAKKYKEETLQDSSAGSSQTAQDLPPNPNGDLTWKHVNDELPQYYSPIHIWDGNNVFRNWSRVWSETMGNIYVNHENRIIKKITHWTAPEGLEYPKYEPLTEEDVKRYTQRDINYILQALTKLIDHREKSKQPSVEYVAGVDDAIITLERFTKPKRMTGKKRGG